MSTDGDRDPKPPLTPDVRGIDLYGENECPGCGAVWERRDLDYEREQLDEMNDRTDYWCPDCGTHVGVRTDYHGPVPVKIGPGIYELQ